MNEHMKSLHGNEKHLKCEPCGIWFETEDKLRRHTSYHTRQRTKSEKCKRCQKKILPGLSMKRHMMTAHKKKLACALCGKENFSGIIQLNSHIVKEHVSKWFLSCFKTIESDVIFVKSFTLADFGLIIFYPKARNSRHITFCDKSAEKSRRSSPCLNNLSLYTPWVIPLYLLG